MTSNPRQLADPSGIDVALGRRIRRLRRDRALSLETLSAKTGLSTGFLSQVERGLSSPSVRVLASVADTLGVSLGALFDPAKATDASEVVVRGQERRQLQLWRSGITKQLLTPPSASSRLAVFLVEMEPGASTGDELYAHHGEEAGYVLRGRMTLTVEDETWRLDKGDSFRFESRRPHRFGNPEDGPTSVLWVNAVSSP
jgi:transcriptional regulator with XRE-family HTH domain